MDENGPAGKRRLSDRSEYDRTGIVPESFPEFWTRPDVKGLLLAMQGRICAYCAVRSNGLDVEHFRPKGTIEEDEAHGGYWWLAYDCSNYFLGCAACNRCRKRNSFPLMPGATRCTFATRETITAEERVLLDAAEDPVEEWLTIDWDDITGRLIPDPGLLDTERARVEDAIELFGLNLDPVVRSERSKAYEQAVRAAAEQRWDDLRRSAMRHHPHSLAARIVLNKLAPQRLPSVGDETKDLVETLWRELRTLAREIRNLKERGKDPRPMDERQLQALCWALVVLRSDPPTGDPATVDDYLGELLERETTEVRTEVVTLFRRLPGALGSGGIMIA
jgi:uncharacterized protein (TIGR02646 family)